MEGSLLTWVFFRFCCLQNTFVYLLFRVKSTLNIIGSDAYQHCINKKTPIISYLRQPTLTMDRERKVQPTQMLVPINEIGRSYSQALIQILLIIIASCFYAAVPCFVKYFHIHCLFSPHSKLMKEDGVILLINEGNTMSEKEGKDEKGFNPFLVIIFSNIPCKMLCFLHCIFVLILQLSKLMFRKGK